MPAIEIVDTTNERPSEDDVCRSLRAIDPFGPAKATCPMPQNVLAAMLPPYQIAREAYDGPRIARRIASRKFSVAIEDVCRRIRAGELAWE